LKAEGRDREATVRLLTERDDAEVLCPPLKNLSFSERKDSGIKPAGRLALAANEVK